MENIKFVKMSGDEFKRFYRDPSIWKDGVCVEEELIRVNGVEVDPYEFDADRVDDADLVEINGGYLVDENTQKDLGRFDSAAKKWMKSQTTKTMMVEVPKDQVDEFKEYLAQKSTSWKVLA